MSKDSIKQEQINKAVWNACDTFRGTVDPSIYKDYVLTMLFVKYLSDVYQDHYDNYVAEYGDTPGLIEELMKNERFVLPRDSGFYALYDQRHEVCALVTEWLRGVVALACADAMATSRQ